jgi:hypothetical protein
MSGGCLYTALLPAAIATEAAAEEPARFAALVTRIHDQWKASDGRTDAQRVTDSLRWVAIVNRCELPSATLRAGGGRANSV